MAYNGPAAGVINIVSGVNTNPAVAPVPPSVDVGGDGDFAYDTDTKVLYGPKDSTQSDPWPTSGLALNAVLRDRGTFKTSGAYNINDVVFDRFSSQQYVCTAAIDYGTPATWTAQTYSSGSIVQYNDGTNTFTYTTTGATASDTPSPSLGNSPSSVWQFTSPGNALSLNYWAAVDPSIAFGGAFINAGGKNFETSLMVPRRILMNGGEYVNPTGLGRTVGNSDRANYLVDALAVDQSSTLTVSGPWSDSSRNTLSGSVVDPTSMGANGPGLTVELKSTAVTPSPTSTGYSRVTVDAYGRVTGASNGLQATWETRSSAGSTLTSSNFAVEFTGSSALTCTIAAPSSTVAGRVHIIKNSTTQTLTVQCTGTPSNSINNSTSYTIPTGTTVQFIAGASSASGQGWRVVTNVLTTQANTFTAGQTIKPTSDGVALTVSNAAGTYAPFSVDSSTGTTTILQGLAFQTLIDGTATATFKSSDGTTILGIDTTNKTLTSGTAATASGTALSSTNKLVDSKTLNYGLNGYPAPNGALTSFGVRSATANSIWWTRFYCPSSITATKLAFQVTTGAASSSDWIDLGIFSSSGTLLASTGQFTGVNTAGSYAATLGSGTGAKSGSANYALTAGTTYYLGVLSSVAITYASCTAGAGAAIYGTTAGQYLYTTTTATGTLTSLNACTTNFASSISSGTTTAAAVFMVVRTD